MRSPRMVHSVVFRNRTGEAVTVVVAYTDAAKHVTKKEVIVPANGSATADEITYAEGTATFVNEITSIRVKSRAPPHGVAAAKLTAPFPGVDGPTKLYEVDIDTSGSGLRFSTNPA